MSARSKVQFWMEFAADFVCLIIANAVSFLFFRYVIFRIVDYPVAEWIRFVSLLVISYAVTFIGFHSGLDISRRSRSAEFIAVIRNTVLTYSLLLVTLALLKNRILESRYLIVSGFNLTVILSSVSRYFLKRWIIYLFKKSNIASIAGIITTSERAEKFVSAISGDWSKRYSGIALLDNFENQSDEKVSEKIDEINDIPVVATDDNYLDWIRSAPLDEIFINLPFEKANDIQEIVEELEDMGITVHLNIPILERIVKESKFDNISCHTFRGYPMASFSAVVSNGFLTAMKRIVDVFAGLVGSICSIPIIAVVAIPLLIESPGPLFFKQDRVGKNGRIFKCYKLRSMYPDAEARKAELMAQNKMEGCMFKMDNDPRITKVGKFIRKYSIDELPQFFNVLKGDMSLIGTRPPTVDEFEQYESRHKRRLSMRPGITGMWQVNGRSNIQNFEDVVKLDCQYIDEWSPMLDTKIFFKTIYVVLTHKGAE